ncbi:MAG: YqeG family HAD IIIA-type phosphatase [Ruminococcaceae bacterium]|nr:YqeG family HAD IIIA-type phosphatase [Oscillospiraceae bacterium]
MASLFLPDYMFDSFKDITPEFLLSIGVHTVLVDIDNTLAPYEAPDPNQHVIRWFEDLRNHGIKAALMSNNDAARVHRFNQSLRLPAYYDCKKPSTRSYVHVISRLGCDRAETCVIGDQIFTDVLTGKRLGLRAILVPPIHDQKTFFFRFKRLLEKPFIYYFKRQQVRKQFLQ